MPYLLEKTAAEDYAAYQAVYSGEDMAHVDWRALTEEIRGYGSHYFLRRDGHLSGGIAMHGDTICAAFCMPDAGDRTAFWRASLAKACEATGKDGIRLCGIGIQDRKALEIAGARHIASKCRMFRPTEALPLDTPTGFRLYTPTMRDLDAMSEVVRAAHAQGFTATIYGAPALPEIRDTLQARFERFERTRSLHLATVAVYEERRQLAGVCMTGIYPDSPQRFATIHQVSVLPAFRRRGLAEAMIRRSVTLAKNSTPIIELGVLIGNPAQRLYEKLGFMAGPVYAEMAYTITSSSPA